MINVLPNVSTPGDRTPTHLLRKLQGLRWIGNESVSQLLPDTFVLLYNIFFLVFRLKNDGRPKPHETTVFNPSKIRNLIKHEQTSA